MIETVEGTFGGKTLRLETGRVARQAGGACWLTMGDTIVLGAATMSPTAREGMDFFPLTCDYEERKYAVGKIPGGFIKRGGRPSEKSILTSRLIDRPVRPLFPYGMRNDVQIIANPLSVDHECLPDVLAVVAASCAIMVSNIPWDGPVGCVRIGRNADGGFIVNPSLDELSVSDLDLIVAGTKDLVNMLEAGASEVSEEVMFEAIQVAHKAIVEQCALQEQLAAKVGRKPVEVALQTGDAAILDAVRGSAGAEIRKTIQNPNKAARETAVSELKKQVAARLSADFPDAAGKLAEAFDKVEKEQIRALIVEEAKRPDGRSLTEIRQITTEVGILPRVHGSGLFTRGQTQVLTAVTLGTTEDSQSVDGLEGDTEKRYMHYYNFPPYSVGETRQLRGPSRRDIGHGALAERALLAVIPTKDTFPYSLLLTSEVLESNGSTSMGATCASTLALMDAGVPIKAPVSGIAMGLMTMGDKYAVLSDIQGMEDFSGDMDFKVAGTAAGITAIQLDTKLHGLTMEIVKATLTQAKDGRAYILGKMMESIQQPREAMSDYAPRIFSIKINPEKIGAVIGPGGKMIKAIEAETGADISIEQDGTIYIAAVSGTAGERAAEMIKGITAEVQVGTTYKGKVVRLMGMGAFVEFLPGKDGLVHISHLSEEPIRRPEEAVKIGDELEVRVIEVDPQGRVNLTAIGLDKPFDPSSVKPREDRGRGGSGGGGDRGRSGGGDRFGGDRGRSSSGGGDRGGDRGGPRSSNPDRGFRGAGAQTSGAAASEPVGETQGSGETEEEDTPRARFRPRR